MKRVTVRSLVYRMGFFMRKKDFRSSMRAFVELCSLKSDEFAVAEWNRLHMKYVY